jgi:hypothetical protein
MLRTALTHLRAQWMGALALFLVIAGGTAYAANTIGSSDIIDGQVKSADIGNNQVYSADVRDDTLPNGGLVSADLKNNQAVRSADVRDETLTGADVADQSGVDTCVSTVRIGQLCFRAENFDRNWNEALGFCADLDLRLPTVAEAIELAQTHDLPDVGTTEDFWTDELIGESTQEAVLADDSGDLTSDSPAALNETVCVTTPTN